jgi:ankyrin repeat protein
VNANDLLLSGARLGLLENVLEAFKFGANVDYSERNGMRKGLTALMLASKGNHVHVIRELLVFKPNLEAKDPDGKTALLLAVCAGNISAADCLLRAGANLEARDTRGYTAVFWACTRRDLKMIHFLNDASARFDALTPDGYDVPSVCHPSIVSEIRVIIERQQLLDIIDDDNDNDNDEFPHSI